ncbi:AAA family ATPase [Rhizobium halophytocola]|uniref:DNA transposition AAA+ family ATPase n=1 Tax=Rhizobium halophytocola TaxID=735519 RepID=A0ABS4E470_9HYPH|nr:AAA family ATPase [Rhizobium halophytocola]MBP1852713.1 DNA transposition AAA+ family ATPase [Rhizobium halophytocola]
MSRYTPTNIGSWDRPQPTPDFLSKHDSADVTEWQILTARVMEVASLNRWTKAEVTRRAGMRDGTFSQWFSGSYLGRLDTNNQTVRHWLDALEDAASLAGAIRQSPRFIKMRGSEEVASTLRWAQMTGDMVMITFGAGMGKTATCRNYVATNPHVYHATVSPHTKTVHGMLTELATELDVQQHNPAKLTRAIGQKLARIGGGSLLIIDEAQNLVDEAINQLRHFVDIYQCGVALVGNEEVYSRFGRTNGGPSYAQLKSRVGTRLKRIKPYLEDLETFIAAWDVTDPDAIKFLIGVGMKGGALRQVDKTVKLAYSIADERAEPLGLKHVQAAWKNRDVEGLA